MLLPCIRRPCCPHGCIDKYVYKAYKSARGTSLTKGNLSLNPTVVFVIGKPFYRIKSPEGNVFVEVVKTIFVSTGFQRYFSWEDNHV